MLFLWILVLFLWLYSVPFLLVSCFLWTPFLIVLLPCCYILNIFFLSDSMTLRGILNNMPYHWWFGKVTRIYLDDRCLVASHPHGVFCVGILCALHFSPGSSTKFAVSPWLFCIPMVGSLARMLGCIPATEEEMVKALQSHTVIVVPGGVPELVSQQLYTRRQGFIRVAKKANVRIVTVVTKSTFYKTIEIPLQACRVYIARKYGIPLIFPWIFGYSGTWLPKRLPVCVEVLPHFNVEGNIEKLRNEYFSRLQSLE